MSGPLQKPRIREDGLIGIVDPTQQPSCGECAATIGRRLAPSIGLASSRPPHQRQRSSHETKAKPPCDQSVGPSVSLQSYPGNGGTYQGGNPCNDGERDE